MHPQVSWILSRQAALIIVLALAAWLMFGDLAGISTLSALALAELAERAGVPAGVFSVVTGKASAIGGVMTSRRRQREQFAQADVGNPGVAQPDLPCFA